MEVFQQLCTSPQVWRLQKGLTGQRLDASYYGPEFLRDSQELESAGYPIKTIGELAVKANCGATPQLVEYADHGTVLIRGGNVTPNSYEGEGAGRVPGLHLPSTSNRCVVQGDLLYTMSGANVGNAAVYPDAGETASFSNTVARARFAPNDVDVHFVCLFLNSRLGMSQTRRLISGGVLPHVMPTSFKQLRIPLPDLEVQSAIGSKLKNAVTARREATLLCEEAIHDVESLVGGTKPLESTVAGNYWTDSEDLEPRIDPRYYRPDYVEVVHRLASVGNISTLGKIAPNMGNGPHGGVDYVDASIGVPYVRAKDLQDFTVIIEDPVFISQKDHESHRRGELIPGDIVVTVTGANIGAVALMPESIRKANLIQSLGKARIESEDDPGYVVAFIGSVYGQLLIQRESVNTAREGINFEYLSNVPILIAEMDVQTSIGNKVRKSQKLRESSQQLLLEANSDIAKLLDGSLDVEALLEGARSSMTGHNDPSDESKF